MEIVNRLGAGAFVPPFSSPALAPARSGRHAASATVAVQAAMPAMTLGQLRNRPRPLLAWERQGVPGERSAAGTLPAGWTARGL
ncbi:MAG: hypothetical protein ACREVL_16565 [Solimonas sp.]